MARHQRGGGPPHLPPGAGLPDQTPNVQAAVAVGVMVVVVSPERGGDVEGLPVSVGAMSVVEAAFAAGMAPNSIAPATALAPTALAATRRAEGSEIDILLAP